MFEGYKKEEREFTQAPFWFWNDELSEDEILRQMRDFRDHGIFAFVVHARAGLPRSISWLSDRMIHFMRVAIEEAVRTGMRVILYDDGMYPSGSSAGQVVAENASFRPRGLFAVDLDDCVPGDERSGFTIDGDGMPIVLKDQNLIGVFNRASDGHRIAVLDRFIKPECSLIRGLHYLDDDPERREDCKEVPEERPQLADILSPEAMKCFIKLVYQRYFDEFGEYFGNTILAIFTDEPSIFGKQHELDAKPGNAEILEFVNDYLGYDFTPHLPALWYEDEPESERFRSDYNRAIQARLAVSYYSPISEWCEEHGIALTGHPMEADAIGHLKYFHLPGQDIVLRHIEPGKPNALEGAESTQAKCASSAMLHLGVKRNMNEFAGAYGHELEFDEYRWLALWLLIRGCNMLIPHAFYYSTRGPRIDERPRDVGPNSPWWGEYAEFADMTGKLSWLNTDCEHVCSLSILGGSLSLPWKSAKICFQNQYDFNYLEDRHLLEDAILADDGIAIAGMKYTTLIIEEGFNIASSPKAVAIIDDLEERGMVVRWSGDSSPDALLAVLDSRLLPKVVVSLPNEDIRTRMVRKNGNDYFMLFNEGESDCECRVRVVDTEFPEFGSFMNLCGDSSGNWSVDTMLSIPSHHIVVVAGK